MRALSSKADTLIASGGPLRLHLGSGRSPSSDPDTLNVDLVELPGVDILADLNEPLDLLRSDSVSEVKTRHTFEHIREFLPLMGELHRVCRSKAQIEIVVPHFSNPYFYSDPTHVRSFGLYTMHYFCDESEQIGTRKVASFYTGSRFRLISTRIDFYRTNPLDRVFVPIIKGLVNLSFKTQEIYERRFCWLWPAWQLKYTLEVIK